MQERAVMPGESYLFPVSRLIACARPRVEDRSTSRHVSLLPCNLLLWRLRCVGVGARRERHVTYATIRSKSARLPSSSSSPGMLPSPDVYSFHGTASGTANHCPREELLLLRSTAVPAKARCLGLPSTTWCTFAQWVVDPGEVCPLLLVWLEGQILGV